VVVPVVRAVDSTPTEDDAVIVRLHQLVSPSRMVPEVEQRMITVTMVPGVALVAVVAAAGAIVVLPAAVVAGAVVGPE